MPNPPPTAAQYSGLYLEGVEFAHPALYADCEACDGGRRARDAPGGPHCDACGGHDRLPVPALPAIQIAAAWLLQGAASPPRALMLAIVDAAHELEDYETLHGEKAFALKAVRASLASAINRANEAEQRLTKAGEVMRIADDRVQHAELDTMRERNGELETRARDLENWLRTTQLERDHEHEAGVKAMALLEDSETEAQRLGQELDDKHAAVKRLTAELAELRALARIESSRRVAS